MQLIYKFFLPIIVCTIPLGNSCFASSFVGLYGVSPSDTKSQKASLVLGGSGTDYQFIFASIFNSEYNEEDFVDSPIPHSDYQDLGEKRIGNTMGFDVAKIIRLEGAISAVYVGGGLYFGKTSRIVKSNATGWLWAQDKKNITTPAIQGGVILNNDSSSKHSFNLGWHSLRGFEIILGYQFD